MTVYRKHRPGIGKWILALIIFGLAMTITFDVADGSEFSDFDNTVIVQNDCYTSSSTYAKESADSESSTEKAPLLLVAGALGVIYAIRRNRA